MRNGTLNGNRVRGIPSSLMSTGQGRRVRRYYPTYVCIYIYISFFQKRSSVERVDSLCNLDSSFLVSRELSRFFFSIESKLLLSLRSLYTFFEGVIKFRKFSFKERKKENGFAIEWDDYLSLLEGESYQCRSLRLSYFED